MVAAASAQPDHRLKENMPKKRTRATLKWLSMDLHIHTQASSDYQQPEVTYLDILQRAETRGLDMVAFTDHNTVAGYRRMWEEIQQLELLKKLKRILPDELARLDEYQRLLKKILVFPAFEILGNFWISYYRHLSTRKTGQGNRAHVA